MFRVPGFIDALGERIQVFAQPVRGRLQGPQFKVRSPMVYLYGLRNQYGTCSGLPNKGSGTWRIIWVSDFFS